MNPFPQLGLAPMEGVTCVATRVWLGLVGGFDFAVTPFLRVTKDYPPKRIPLTYAPESRWKGYTLIPQLMGQNVPDLVPIAQALLKDAPHVDFNCGCPSPTVVGNGAGSSLLRSQEGFARYVSSLATELGASNMSIKMRVGFDTADEFLGLLDGAAKVSLAQLTIHGRTRAERYTGVSRWTPMSQALGRGLKVVGSGDVLGLQTFLEKIQIAPTHKVMIGRGALRNPFVFHEIRSGKPLKISKDLLRKILGTALLLHAFLEKSPHQLLEWAENMSGFNLGADEALWEQVLESLVEASLRSEAGRRKPMGESQNSGEMLASQPHTADSQSWLFRGVSIPKGSYFKVKMIWNYLRTSLPTEFLDATCLRAPNPVAFWVALDAVLESLPEVFELRHRIEYDWIFSGGGKT